MLNFETCCVKLEFRVRSSEFRAVADRKLKDFKSHLGSCQNYGPFLGTLNIRCRVIIRTQQGTIILTTTHLAIMSLQAALNLKLPNRKLPNPIPTCNPIDIHTEELDFSKPETRNLKF